MLNPNAFLTLAAALATALGEGEASYQPESLPKGVLHFPLTRPSLQQRVNVHIEQLHKRATDNTVELVMRNQITSFSASLNIGSNNQNVSVLVDTGSSDLWVMSTDNTLCTRVVDSQPSSPSRDGLTCIRSTMFDPEKSSSFSLNSTLLSIQYGDGTFANGSYCQDTISYGGATIKNANFAIANASDSTTSVWGIGLKGLESIVTTYDQSGNFSPTYSNLPIQMKEQGIIGSVAYSMWLNSVDASAGSLLFGGIDHEQYSGSLQKVPLLSSYAGAKPNEMQVKLDGIKLFQDDNEDTLVDCATEALLDSGTTYMMLPEPFVEVIVGSIGGSCSQRGCFAPCNLNGGLKFQFSGIEIEVPFEEFLFQVSSASQQCLVGMLPSRTLILGDTFLRSAYVVYDLENYEVAIAKTNLNATSSNIEAITNGIPSATQAASYSSTNLAPFYTTNYPSFFTVGRGSTVSPRGTAGQVGSQSQSTSSFQGGGGVGPIGSNAASTMFFGQSSAAATGTTASATREQKNGAPASMRGASLYGSLIASVVCLLLYV